MQILQATGGIASTNCFLVGDESSRQAVLFDAPDHTVASILDQAAKRQWDVIGLWLTHGHFDHLADHAVVTSRFPNSRLLVHRLDEAKLTLPMSQILQLPFEIPQRKADGYIEDAQTMKIGSIEVVPIFTPGHSPGHLMYHIPSANLLIGGDLIFANGVGRTDFPDCDANELFVSIRKVMKLPPQTRLLPGHGPSVTLAKLRESNPFVIEALSQEKS